MTTFTLPRILDAAPAAAKPPDIGQAPDDRLESVPVRFHPRLTDDQRLALAHKLRILGGCVTLPRRGVFEFMRRFSDQPPSPEAVWPPVLDCAASAASSREI